MTCHDDLKEDLESCKERYWKGRDLPFPILFDDSGTTIRELGIAAYPTLLLIDPEGKLRRHGSAYALRKELMRTDPAVQGHLRALGRLGVSSLKREAGELAVEGGDAVAWALMLLAEDVSASSERKVLTLLPILAGMEDERAHGFLLGEHGLGSKSAKVRMAALRAWKLIEDPPEVPPWRVTRALKSEEDKRVRKLLEAWLEELKAKAEKAADGE